MGKNSRFNKKNSVTFKLMFRSQSGPDPNLIDRVLVPTKELSEGTYKEEDDEEDFSVVDKPSTPVKKGKEKINRDEAGPSSSSARSGSEDEGDEDGEEYDDDDDGELGPEEGEDEDDDLDLELLDYPEDGYDYSQHMRSGGGGVYVPADEDYVEKVLKNFNMNYKLNTIKEKGHMQYVNADGIQDKDIDSALFTNQDNAYEELDDDFVLQANEGILLEQILEKDDDFGSEDDDVDAVDKSRIKRAIANIKDNAKPAAEASKKKKQTSIQDKYAYRHNLTREQIVAIAMAGGINEDEDLEFDEDGEEFYDEDDENASQNGSSSRERRIIDDQFDNLLHEYDEIGMLNPADPMVRGTMSVDNFKNLFQEFESEQRKKIKRSAFKVSSFVEVEKISEEEKKKAEEDKLKPPAPPVEEDPESEDDTKDIDIVYVKKDEGWDIESIISTYSNLENHPSLIIEPSSKKITISKKTGMPIGVLESRHSKFTAVPVGSTEDEEEEEDEGPTENLGKARAKSETAEEKRARKKAVKDERKAGREKKKNLKEAYKSEEMKQTAQLAGQRLNSRVVYKF